MKHKIYICSSSCISAQETFANPEWHNNLHNPENNLYHCVEPDYKDILDAGVLRRMNRVQKFNLCAALTCLQRVNKSVDAIIIATGWGCIDSTYKFLERLFDQKGLPANPAAFIQSTHNTMAAQTAIYIKNNAYNNTVTDNQSPFELALDNALICMQDNDYQNILVGACDEIIPQLADFLNKISKFGKQEIIGEGGTCFILSKEKENSIAEIKYFSSMPVDNVPEIINNLSEKYSVDYIFTAQKEKFSTSIPLILYTDYFGNFPASSACGLWLAVDCLNSDNPAISHAQNILLISKNKQGIAFITVVGK
ncbi:MAG: beta-ketoacyl synthase chain length factor [Dysgonamonadaceae bacterium]|jgi:hypothetical protein|nr:beta-ketoacyl synthase chain length factor [Dysgonamonadaceae bacterium]